LTFFRTTGAIAAVLVGAACSNAPAAVDAASALSEDVIFESRGIAVPATFVRPAAGAAAPFPVVVMAHGHGGTREEAGGFRRLAEALAVRGIASIRPDFPGCGQSEEPFTRNNLTNMRADAQAALAYAHRQAGVDAERTGILGYSMGARVAMLMLPDGYAAAVLWSPVGLDGPAAIFPLTGGRSAYIELRNQAAKAGTAAFVTPWGQHQLLGMQWFGDLEAYRPMAAVESFTGALLVLSGAEDTIIGPDIARAVAAAAASSKDAAVEILAGAGHGLGFYDDDATVSELVIDTTAEFFVSKLLRGR
jgi:dienelactone hydrolase